MVPVDVKSLPGGPAKPVRTAVAGSATSRTLLKANPGRRGAIIYNDSTSRLFVAFGDEASMTDFTMRLNPQDYFEVPFGYIGEISGIWQFANGNARVTELF